MFVAGVAHPVERHLAKVEVASSSLVARSIKKTSQKAGLFFYVMRVVWNRVKCIIKQGVRYLHSLFC